MGVLPHEHAIDLLVKNLCLYLPMGTWLVMNLVIYVHGELERLKYFSHAPPFE